MKSADLRLLLSYSSSRRLFFAVIGASLVWAAIVVSHALLIARIIVGIIGKHEHVTSNIALLAALLLLRSIFQANFEYWCSSQAIRMKADLRREVSSQLALLPPTSSANLSTLMIKGLNTLDIYLGRFIPQLFFAVTTPMAVIATIFFLDKLSAFIAVITLPLIPFFGALIGKYTSDSVMKKWRSLGTLSSYFEDSLRGFVTLKIFGRDRSQHLRIKQMGDEYTSATMKVLRISFLSAFVLELCATISVALIAVAVGLRLVDGNIGFAPSLVILILAPEVYFPLRNAASLFHASADGAQALGEIRDLLEQIPVESGESLDIDFSGLTSISWKDWNLDLPGVEPSRLDSARVSLGQSLFIVGESGIGKSTFALNVIGARFDAEVTIENHNSKVLLEPESAQSWQSVMSWVPQNPQLARTSIRGQFLLANENLTDVHIENLLTSVGLNLLELPDGLDTEVGGVGEKTSSASGGQIRKIAVARALARNPRVIVADEPTADLDLQSAHVIISCLQDFVNGGGILIAITHEEFEGFADAQYLHMSRGQQ